MKQVILVAGLSTALMSPLAFAELTLYGKAHLAIDYSEVDGVDDSKTDLVNHDSRVGIKGKTKINDSLSAIFKYEMGVDIDGNTGDSDFLTQRNQYVGIQGGFGQLFGGIHDTPLKQLEGKIDRFGDTNADIGKVLDYYVDAQEREKRFLGYFSPNMGGVQFKIATMPGKADNADFGDAISTSIAYGDPKMKKTPFFVGVGYDSEVDGEDTNVLRFSGSAKMGHFGLGAIVEQADDGTNDHMRYVGSAYYKIGNGALEVQYANAEELGSKKGSDQWSIGWDHTLGGGASAYIMYSQQDIEEGGKETDFASVGFVYKF